MGIIRKSLYLGTGGLVSPNAKKQRRQMQTLKAMQGQLRKRLGRQGPLRLRGILGNHGARLRRTAAESRATQHSSRQADPRRSCWHRDRGLLPHQEQLHACRALW